MDGKLYIVGTPIGNILDFSQRGIDILNTVDIIACEDTRHSRKLLDYYGIKTKLISYHKFSEQKTSEHLIQLLKENKNVALISDAGMPCISDPGAILVSKAQSEGIKVESVPGPSALTTAFALSGIIKNNFIFLGFLPDTKKEQKEIISKAVIASMPIIIYCAPHKLNKTLNLLYELIGAQEVVLIKELTKIYENIQKGTLGQIEIDEPKGEYVIIIDYKSDNPLNQKSIKEHVRSYIELGISKKEAIKKVSKDRGVEKNIIYKEVINDEFD